MNFIIRILGHVPPTCSCVGPFATTCCIDTADFSNYEIHSDANAFLTPGKDYYRFTIAPSYWEQFNELAKERRIKTIDKISKEVCPRDQESMKDPVQKWYEDKYDGITISTKQVEIVEEYQAVMTFLHSSEKYSEKAFREWSNESVADPWLIAVAKAFNYTIVSFETMRHYNGGTPMSSAKIPNVCQDLDVPYTNLFSMMEDLNIQL